MARRTRPTVEELLDEITSCTVRIRDGEKAREERLDLFEKARSLDPPVTFETLAAAAGVSSRHVVINALARRSK